MLFALPPHPRTRRQAFHLFEACIEYRFGIETAFLRQPQQGNMLIGRVKGIGFEGMQPKGIDVFIEALSQKCAVHNPATIAQYPV